jgi:hypothetical protein
MKRILVAILAVATVLAPAVAGAKVVSQLGIGIQSCVVNNNGGRTNGINVVYSNTHASPAVEVDFLVGYHGHRAVLSDRGTFSQYAVINHNITSGLVGYPWDGPKPKTCTVQHVVLQNGKVFTL